MKTRSLAAAVSICAVLLSGCSEGVNSATTVLSAPPEVSTSPTENLYTAVVIDKRTDSPGTSTYQYYGNLSPYQLVKVMEAKLGVAFGISDAAITENDIRIDFRSDGAVVKSSDLKTLNGLLESLACTMEKNYGEDKSIYFTVDGAALSLFGVAFSAETPYVPEGSDAGTGDLLPEDASIYAINLTYGILGNSDVLLGARINGRTEVNGLACYDITVFAESDPGSCMRRFAISVDGVEAFIYSEADGAFITY